MSKTKLNKVVLKNVDAAVIVAKVDNRTNNPGRPINKQSARYKRLAKQAFYTKQKNQFVNGKQFYVPNVISGLHYSSNADNNLHSLGSGIFNELSEHICTVDYIGRTKVTGFKYVLGKRVSVELNLKQIKYTA